jgi:hypothetical protein
MGRFPTVGLQCAGRCRGAEQSDGQVSDCKGTIGEALHERGTRMSMLNYAKARPRRKRRAPAYPRKLELEERGIAGEGNNEVPCPSAPYRTRAQCGASNARIALIAAAAALALAACGASTQQPASATPQGSQPTPTVSVETPPPPPIPGGIAEPYHEPPVLPAPPVK